MDGDYGNSDSLEVVRVSVKDKRSAACLICRNRKRKCDGNDPCGYCASKGWMCQYTQQKKRGPQKKPELTPVVSVQPSLAANEMLDKIEGQTFTHLYLKYINLIVPMTSPDKCISPATPAQKVQSYAAMAYSARICGDLPKARKYINQARLISGTIYDSLESDSVCGILMMANFYQLVIDIPLSTHYSRLAHSLSRLIPKNQLEYRIKMVCQVGDILTTEGSNQKKAKKLNKAATDVVVHGQEQQAPYAHLMGSFLRFTALIVEALDYNAIFMTSAESFPNIFYNFSTVQICEEKRSEILKAANDVSVNVIVLAANDVTKHVVGFMDMFIPLYMGIIDWRTGHMSEALHNALTCLRGMNVMQNSQAFAYACGVVDMIHIVMLGGICEFLYEIGQYNFAIQMCDKIRLICNILTPEFDFIIKQVEVFLAKMPPTDALSITPVPALHTTVSPLSPLSPLSPSTSPSSSSPNSPLSPFSTQPTYPLSTNSNFSTTNTSEPPNRAQDPSKFYLTSYDPDMSTTITNPMFVHHIPTTEVIYFNADHLLNTADENLSCPIDLSAVDTDNGLDQSELELLTVVP